LKGTDYFRTKAVPGVKKMLRKALPVLLVLISLGVSSVLAQRVYTPRKGSSQRKVILNTLRIPIQKELRQRIVFYVDNFNVSGRWAFVSGEPRTRSGRTPNYRGTKYQSAVDADMFDNNFFALLRKRGKRWRIVTYYIGCTDVCYAGWWKKYRAPKAIFPYTE
jgi:hypothetical protein